MLRGRPATRALRIWARFALLVLVLVGAVLEPRPAFAGDPYLQWFTLSTPHFRVHYHSGLEEVAQRAASVAERAHNAVAPQLGWQPTEVTHLVLSDDSDSANGVAYTVPYNTVRLFVTAPEDMSPLSDYDDWQVELVTHEYTHVLHLDNVSGLPALFNAIFGKVQVPNQSQPRWILEGIAVAMESLHTAAGRLKSSQFEMYLRTDVLEGHLATLDEISQNPRRWPGGELWYLYGSKFIEWILQTYGEDTFARVATEYGRFIIPYGINRAIRRATGHTYPELYAAWKATLEARYAEQAAKVSGRGIREGKRLTHGGRLSLMPRFVPDQCATGGKPELVYFRDDGVRRAGLYRIGLEGGDEEKLSIVSRTLGTSSSFLPDCSLVFDSYAPSRRSYMFLDLFRLPKGINTPAGDDLRRERLTVGRRAREPDVSPDGTRITYVTNDKGTTTLKLAELSADAKLLEERTLVRSDRFEQAYTPRFSPDGSRIAYSVWRSGGYRDIRLVELSSGALVEVTHDRAIDQQPAWSADGKTLYFTSDRSGIANVYAYDLADHTLHQVTNVQSGAYMPQISADGSTMVYVGYTSRGFDLFTLPIDRSRWLEPLPLPARPDGRVSLRAQRWPVSSYNPLSTLRPRAYRVDYGTGTYGNALTLSTRGSDAVGHHGLYASAILESEGPEWRATLDYDYGRLPFGLRVSAFRDAKPREGYRVGEIPETVTEHTYGIGTALGLNIPGEFDGQSAAFGFTVARFSHDAPLGNRVDPWATVPVEPSSGILATAHLGYSYANTEGSVYAISAERGIVLSLSADFADPAFGSGTTLTAISGALIGYIPLPWISHHVLALSASGGSAAGTYPRLGGYFYTGGFEDLPAYDVYTSGIRQSGFVLRGFRPKQFFGTEYTLLNAEYRFPIAYVDRGVSTLPAFLETLSGTFFADWGGAYDRIDPHDPLEVLHLGVGAELWIQLMLGYRIDGSLRLGMAHGFGEGSPGALQTYFVAASAF